MSPELPPNLRSSDLAKQLQQAWEEAQGQLTRLRQQVEEATALAHAKVQSNVLERDLDRAYRDLGEAVWAEVSKGKLQLAAGLSSVRQALEEVTAKIRVQNASINDLLAEGADIADRLQEKMVRASKAVAPPQKKR